MQDKQSPYHRFSSVEWGELRKDMPLFLTEETLKGLRGVGETVSLHEVEQVYLPLSRLLNLYVEASQGLFRVTNSFLGREKKVPYIIGIAGSVAVGKSTTSRILKALLSGWASHPHVELVTTDGFLLPNLELEKRNLMSRKGFPESFDLSAVLSFLTDIKSGAEKVLAPVYSHVHYDVMENETLTITSPDILIVEGLNVLQTAKLDMEGSDIPFVSDFFDFSIYIDTDSQIIEKWYVERFLNLRSTAFREKDAYFQRYSDLKDEEARKIALDIWEKTNLVNLQKNILPTRGRANCILHKGEDHHIDEVFLRKL